jgi:glycosyltransferase involved in cell wall biosynthesis
MKTLLLIPSVRRTATPGEEPQMDYDALAAAIEARGHHAEIADFTVLNDATEPLVKLARRYLDKDSALAVLGFVRRKRFDAIFCNSESISLPLACLLKGVLQRPRVVSIGHRLTAGKKKPFFTILRAHRQIAQFFVYTRFQKEYAEKTLGVAPSAVTQISFHADTHFFQPQAEVEVNPAQIGAAGLEWRDYETLVAAVRERPEWQLRIATGSPWSKRTNAIETWEMPSHIVTKRYTYEGLREMYAQAAVIAVPLAQNDFSAGVTAVLEGMAMGKPVIVTQTTGQAEAVIEGVTGFSVPVGDVAAFQAAIERLLDDPELRATVGQNARCWVEQNAPLTLWARRIAEALCG